MKLPGIRFRPRAAAGLALAAAIVTAANAFAAATDVDTSRAGAKRPEPDSFDSLSLLAPDSTADEGRPLAEPERWRRAPFGDRLLTDPEEWRARTDRTTRVTTLLDYNRVDPVRLGLRAEAQSPERSLPRLGARLEYATGRERWLYGAQIEQPLPLPGRLALGVSMVRRTDHGDLQQVEDVENSLALLFGRQDYRDYFEREGLGAYVSARLPEFSTVSLHVRNDVYRSLALDRGTRSLFQRHRDLRENPPVDEGENHAWILGFERLARRTQRTRAGFYHWAAFERAGGALGGDFAFTRALADLRSVLRLSPATTLTVRLVGGHTPRGTLPVQKHFTVGGVDGLRAHSFASDRGDQMLLGQAEYGIGLWRLRASGFEGGLHAIAFVDVGRAWFNPNHDWDLDRQRVRADGGFGLGTSEENLRVYFAKNLQEPESDFVISVRLNRPF